MNGRYILEGHQLVACPDLVTWATWLETADRQVALTEVAPGIAVSTVFLGLDYGFRMGPPQLFETMAFNDLGSIDCDELFGRYATWSEAEAGHAAIVERLKERLAVA